MFNSSNFASCMWFGNWFLKNAFFHAAPIWKCRKNKQVYKTYKGNLTKNINHTAQDKLVLLGKFNKRKEKIFTSSLMRQWCIKHWDYPLDSVTILRFNLFVVYFSNNSSLCWHLNCLKIFIFLFPKPICFTA